jgi:hypothetical protein
MKKHKNYFTSGNITSYYKINPVANKNWRGQRILQIPAAYYCSLWKSFFTFIKELTHVSKYIISAYINDDVIQELNELNIKVILNKSLHHKQLINKSREILAKKIIK